MKYPMPPKKLPPKLTGKLPPNNRCDEFSLEGAGAALIIIVATIIFFTGVAWMVFYAS